MRALAQTYERKMSNLSRISQRKMTALGALLELQMCERNSP